MADHPTPLDPFDVQENSPNSNDDFEKVDAPIDTGFSLDRGDEFAAPGAYESNQDAEISTTTDADISGEQEAEKDPFYMGASEAESEVMMPHSEPLIPHSEPLIPHSEPLIALGDEDDDPIKPSAPVPENTEPLVNFDNAAGDDPLQLFNEPAPSSTTFDSFLTSHNPISPHLDAFNENDKSEPIVEEESKETSSNQSESAMDVSKGSWLKGVDPREEVAMPGDDDIMQPFIDLIYWRDVKKTGIVFGAMMVVLLSFAICSLLSVVAYLSLAILTVTFSFTIYKKVMGAVQKSNDGHPFKQLIEKDITLREEKLKSVIQSCLKHVNCTVSELRRLFLIEDMVDSIKFGLLLWVLTYIGAWFNGMTLVILGVIFLFTLPKVYETYQVQIDNYLGLAKAQIDNVFMMIQNKVPFLKKKKDKTQ